MNEQTTMLPPAKQASRERTNGTVTGGLSVKPSVDFLQNIFSSWNKNFLFQQNHRGMDKLVIYQWSYRLASFHCEADLFLQVTSCCDGLVHHHRCLLTQGPLPLMARAALAPRVTDP